MLPAVLPRVCCGPSSGKSAAGQRRPRCAEQRGERSAGSCSSSRAPSSRRSGRRRSPDLSDRDRSTMTPFKPPNPRTTAVLAREHDRARRSARHGGTAEAQPNAQPSPSESASRETGSPAPGPPGRQQADDPVLRGLTGPAPKPQAGNDGTGTGGSLRARCATSARYVPQQIFDNPQGGGQFGSAIQFDTKGVEFGPWVRRFIAQIKRNWFIPYAAMSMRGHVVSRSTCTRTARSPTSTVRRAVPASTPSTTRRSTPSRRRTPPSRCRRSTRPTGRSSPSRSTTTRRRPSR